MSFVPKPQEIYRHFKGNLYQVITLARHTETGETLVVYQAVGGGGETYARPLAMFAEKLDREKYPGAAQEYRFELQGAGAESAGETQERAERAEGQTQEDGELQLDPMLLEFLDTDSYEQRLNILAGLQHRITDQMITTMAIACDVEIDDGDTQERYEALKTCLLMLERYECNRIR